jgi:hypothetical protein
MLKRSSGVKGLSTIIANLLIILLTLVAVGIIWAVVRNVITNQSEIAQEQGQFFYENIQMASYNVNGSLVSISLKRTGGSQKVQSQSEETEVTGIVETDIISVVDLSGSMRTCNGVVRACCNASLNGTFSLGECSNINSNKKDNCTTICGGIWVDKLDSAQQANKELINILLESEGSRIGLVGYNTTVVASASLNLTNDISQLNNKIDSWQASGTTCICCGINEAVKQLQQLSSNGRDKKIIVMSDGEPNVLCAIQNTGNATQDSIKASCDAKEDLEDLIVYSIGVGENVVEETLINISNCGGGKYFSAINISELIEVYRYVAEDIVTTYTSTTKFNYMYIIFYNGTSSYKEKISNLPEILATQKYEFDLTGKLEGKITKVEIYPVVLSKSKKEIIGPLFDSWEL